MTCVDERDKYGWKRSVSRFINVNDEDKCGEIYIKSERRKL